MNTNTMELNMNEMEMVNGGGLFSDCKTRASNIFDKAVCGMCIGGIAGSTIGLAAGGTIGACTGALIGMPAGAIAGAIYGAVTYEEGKN